MPHDFGTPPSQVWLYVDRFIIDESYQRKISAASSQKLITRIAADFRWSAFQSVLAAPAEDNHWTLIDGHHRIEGAKRIRNSDGSPAIPMVPATVIDAKSPEAQADACVRINFDRRPFDALALHRAKLVQGDAKAATIERLVTNAGLMIPAIRPSRSTIKPGEVICLGALTKIVNQYAPNVAEVAVGVVAAAYKDEPFGVRAPFLLAAAELTSSGETDRESLLRAFKQSTSDALCREVGGHNTAKSTVNVLEALRKRLADQKEALRDLAADMVYRQPHDRDVEKVQVDNSSHRNEHQNRAERQALTLPPLPPPSAAPDPPPNPQRKAELEKISAWTAEHNITKCPSGPEMKDVPFMEYDAKAHKWKRTAS